MEFFRVSPWMSLPQEQDEKAIVSLQDRIIQGTQSHEEGFAEWLRQRDQQAMVAGTSWFQPEFCVFLWRTPGDFMMKYGLKHDLE